MTRHEQKEDVRIATSLFTSLKSANYAETAQEKNLKVGHKGVSPSTKLSTSTRGISPNFNAKPMTTPVELSIKNKNDQI